MQIQPLIEGEYFHIYNRGINGEDIFKEKRNYYYFLEQYKHYCSDVFETFAYALLKNHFHLLVYVKEDIEVAKNNGQGFIRLNASKQLSHFFNSYSQSINKAYKRTGSLFESPFKRKLIDDEGYITSMIAYCHFNAQHHKFVSDFRDWEFSSYHSILENSHPFLATQKTLDWFGGLDGFKRYHVDKSCEMVNEKFVIE
jgi:REP element-mobilizing transposase RayT